MGFKEDLKETIKNPELRAGVESVLVDFAKDVISLVKEKIPGKIDDGVIDTYVTPQVQPVIDRFLDKHYVEDKD